MNQKLNLSVTSKFKLIMNNQNNKKKKKKKKKTNMKTEYIMLSPRGNRWSEISRLQSKYLAVSQ